MTKEDLFNKADKVQGWFTREDMENLYNLANEYVKKGGMVVEVGSWKGRSSTILAEVCKEKGAKLTCIDSFKGLVDTAHSKWEVYHGKNDGYYREGNHGSIIENIKKNLEGYDVTFLEGSSTELHKKIKDASCDLIFIDGDHDEPIVSEDMKNFLPKIKKGGVFCGHDYAEGNTVAIAVDTHVGETGRLATIWIKPIL